MLKGKIAPKKPAKTQENPDEEEKDDPMSKPVRPEDVAMGIDGDVEKNFKMLGFFDPVWHGTWHLNPYIFVRSDFVS